MRRAGRMLPAGLAAAAILAGCGGDGRSASAAAGDAATAAGRQAPLNGVRAPADVCRMLSERRLRAALLDPDLLPGFERHGYRLRIVARRLLLDRATKAPACVYDLRRAGRDFDFLVVLVARGGDQEGLRKWLREQGDEDTSVVDVAGRMSYYALGDRRTIRTQLAVPAGDATLILRPGRTLGLDKTRDEGFSPDRRRDSVVNIARMLLGEPYVRP